MRRPEQGQDGSRLHSIAGGRAAHVRDDSFSPPASLAIPVEDYQAVRKQDLVRIRERVENAPPVSPFWGNAGWTFFAIGSTAAITASTFESQAPMLFAGLAILAVFLLVIAGLCGIFQLNLNEERHRNHNEALTDLDRTIGDLD